MPVLPVKALPTGWQTARIEGFEYTTSTTGNPMVKVEVSLESGELTDIYLIVTQDCLGFESFLSACGEDKVASSIRAKLNPSFELDDLIGRTLKIDIPKWGGFIKNFIRDPNAKRS